MRRAVLLLFTLAYLGLVAWMTLRPEVYGDRTSNLLWRALGFFSRHDETAWITFDRVEFASNVIMFLPMGALVVLLLPRRFWWLGVLVGFAASWGIESYQSAYLDGRVSDVRDLVSNTLGATIGAAFTALLLPRRRRRKGRRPQPSARARVAS
ncbi:VanZ family protein [Frigoribacterium sp. ACAM 257]|uniref:VanZ family protein n=1 Tax=Frigoribacterium sp. ACAM 257 TaxID=2508998 RepID=UPI0011B95C86|nr:VanZ family protein [Frigoribacterium sp. ACAM 257]TWX37370.1 VanZ family protein [Frigoribacterium sp. ACAM 257]